MAPSDIKSIISGIAHDNHRPSTGRVFYKWYLAFIFSAAGPLSNLLVMVAARDGGLPVGIATLLSTMFSLSLLLLTFNLILVPPLDGSGLIPLLVSKERAVAYMDFIRSSHFSLPGIFISWKILDLVFNPLHLMFIDLLYPEYGFH